MATTPNTLAWKVGDKAVLSTRPDAYVYTIKALHPEDGSAELVYFEGHAVLQAGFTGIAALLPTRRLAEELQSRRFGGMRRT